MWRKHLERQRKAPAIHVHSQFYGLLALRYVLIFACAIFLPIYTLLKYFTRKRLFTLLFLSFPFLPFGIIFVYIFSVLFSFLLFYFVSLFNFHFIVIECEVNIKRSDWKVTRAISWKYFFFHLMYFQSERIERIGSSCMACYWRAFSTLCR